MQILERSDFNIFFCHLKVHDKFEKPRIFEKSISKNLGDIAD